MAKDKKDKGNGAAQAERIDVEQQPGEVAVAAEGERDQASATVAELATDGSMLVEPATDAPQDEPGPEDFERHAGARLLADQGADLRLQEDAERRLRKRGDVIAKRLRKSGVNATVEINGVEYVARQRPKCNGELMLSEVPKLVKSALDI